MVSSTGSADLSVSSIQRSQVDPSTFAVSNSPVYPTASTGSTSTGIPIASESLSLSRQQGISATSSSSIVTLTPVDSASSSRSSATSIIKPNMPVSSSDSKTQSSVSVVDAFQSTKSSYPSITSADPTTLASENGLVGSSSSAHPITLDRTYASAHASVTDIVSRVTDSTRHTTLVTSNINIQSEVGNPNYSGPKDTTITKQSAFMTSPASTSTISNVQSTASVMNHSIEDNISAAASLESVSGTSTKDYSCQSSAILYTKSFTTTTTNAFITSKHSIAAVSTGAITSSASISLIMEGSANIEAVGKLVWLAAALPLAFI